MYQYTVSDSSNIAVKSSSDCGTGAILSKRCCKYNKKIIYFENKPYNYHGYVENLNKYQNFTSVLTNYTQYT